MDLMNRIKQLKEEKNAVILAHYYVDADVQAAADFIGDSFYLAKKAAETDADKIVFAGVEFMGESAKILNPTKHVYMPDAHADCPMAHMVTIEKIKEMREKYDDLAVVCYINSTAEIKTYSDVCVTSSNAVKIVNKLPNKNIFFVPDQNLGSYVATQVKNKNIILNSGFCPRHHIMTKEDVLGSLREVIRTLETWDITTIRASIGMYLLCKYIHEHTDLKVILTGEVSDELFGYKYTDFAPSPEEFQKESQKRMRELYMYDVLRADRCISANALEGRVPFADLDFVDYTMRIDPKKKMNTYNKGKYLLRHAFEGLNYLPQDILFREKAAFSDAVGHSMVDYLKEYADSLYTDEDVVNAKEKYPYCTPFTKESLLYRDIFESYYPGKAKWIKDFWMPNKTWENCDVNDPSARVLKNYGDSGK